MKSTEFVITRLDTQALQVMRHVEVDLDQPPTNVLPRPQKVPATRAVATTTITRGAKRARVSWPALISVSLSVLTFVVLACVAALNG